MPPVVLRAAILLAVGFGVAAPALAMSLKNIMGQMGDTTKQAKHLSAGPFDLASARAVLDNYDKQASAGTALYAGRSDAKSQDLRGRFAHLASVANSGRGSLVDQASFRRAFTAVAEDCRSCHAVYK